MSTTTQGVALGPSPYTVHEPIGSGGMASVHFGVQRGAAGFVRVVAIKRLRADRASDPNVAAMLLDEARLMSRVHHPNVVHMLDAVLEHGELFLVLEYVHGESLARLLRAASPGDRIPEAIALTIATDVLRGLHAAHEAKGNDGQPLDLVHRDVSPSNVVIDEHGVARVLDFGIAKARHRAQETATGQLKGRMRYMAPEQVHGEVTRRSDIFAAGVLLWELVTGEPLFGGDSDGETLAEVLGKRIPTPSERGVALPMAFERALMQALDRRPSERFESALRMVEALSDCPHASRDEVAAWVHRLAGESLSARERRLRELRVESTVSVARAQERGDGALAIEASPREQRATGRKAWVALVVAGLAVVTWLVATWPRERERADASPSAPSGLPTRAASELDVPAAVAPVAIPTTLPASPSRQPAAPSPRAPPRLSHSAAPAKAPCAQPWSVDADGVRVYNRECFSARP
jgi:tRNA A-37 threonylcarbamoyl transferase component Bud32